MLSSSLAAASGSRAMSMSFCIIPSIGSTSNVSMSLENICMSRRSTKQTKRVLAKEKKANLELY